MIKKMLEHIPKEIQESLFGKRVLGLIGQTMIFKRKDRALLSSLRPYVEKL